MRLLLIEDDPMIGESMEEVLRRDNYAVDWVRDGDSGMLALRQDVYDLLLLDLGLPKKQGMQVLKHYRAQGGAAPVLIVSARDATASRVEGLDSGADDYLVKPFDVDELLARIRALLRRGKAPNQAVVHYRGLQVDMACHVASFNGQPLHLPAREFAVLRALLDSPGSVVPKIQLEERIYGWGEEIESNTIDVYIHHLRKKLGTGFIQNVRGVGYKLAAA
ncbi:response regulator [Duganella sp. FT80W]|uniref:Response regulator n=1 Tax=Duganella guangzhouensis TaxID=2666084 RepID=A0A6I2L067_9BURK|nr:response regulator transcription factor [Duganella guangzhouensis]MRW89926.1 response regulator [Duganella guangzhouensis]